MRCDQISIHTQKKKNQPLRRNVNLLAILEIQDD